MGLLAALGIRPGSTSRVTMVVSVDTDHVAGEKYDIPVELADRYILRGYATGNLSREYSADERNALTANSQVVGF